MAKPKPPILCSKCSWSVSSEDYGGPKDLGALRIHHNVMHGYNLSAKITPEYPERATYDWHSTFLLTAQLISTMRSHCQRYQVGCVITPPDGSNILAFGYNGNYAGGPNICDDPTVPGGCGCIHAEENALVKCDNSYKDKVIYVTAAPCERCAKLITNSGASLVVYSNAYRHTKGLRILAEVGIPTQHIPNYSLPNLTIAPPAGGGA